VEMGKFHKLIISGYQSNENIDKLYWCDIIYIFFQSGRIPILG